MENSTVTEVMQFVQQNDVKFIRLAFCDMFGTQKNISIMPAELTKAFTKGITVDPAAIRGFVCDDQPDLYLKPNAHTLTVLPWRPSQGRVIRFYCDIVYSDGTPYEQDCRAFLRKTIQKAADKGYKFKLGVECEFYLFKLNEDGEPTFAPHDHAGYCDISPLDKGENVRREICLSLEEMGLLPEASHHEQGPGQNEIDFNTSDPLTAADNFITFKSVVRAISARNGLYASFLPKPLYNKSGSGMHFNLSINHNHENIFKNAFSNNTDDNGKLAAAFVAGVLEKTPEITAFLNCTTNSYKRLGQGEAPTYASWSHKNRSQLIRIPLVDGEYCRMELRSPDPACNPYLAFALMIEAGMYGIENNIPMPHATDINLRNASDELLKNLKRLPSSLDNALALCKNSSFVNDVLPASILQNYCVEKQKEHDICAKSQNYSEAEMELYFLNI